MPNLEDILTPHEELISGMRSREEISVSEEDYDFDDKSHVNASASVIAQCLERSVAEIFSPFRDQTVVDIGCGKSPYGYMIAAMSRADAYVGVDVHNAGWARGRLRLEMNAGALTKTYRTLSTLGEKALSEEEYIPAAFEEEDMLTFLQRLPKHSVSVWAAAIDDVIIPRSYSARVKEEITRVTHPEGAFMQWGSTLKPENMEKEDIDIGLREQPIRKYTLDANL